jgi:hypothetical protein
LKSTRSQLSSGRCSNGRSTQRSFKSNATRAPGFWTI